MPGIGVISAQNLVGGFRGAAVEGFGGPVVSLVAIEGGQVVETDKGVGVLAAQDFLAKPERLLVVLERAGIVPFAMKQVTEVVEAGECLGVFWAQDAF